MDEDVSSVHKAIMFREQSVCMRKRFKYPCVLFRYIKLHNDYLWGGVKACCTTEISELKRKIQVVFETVQNNVRSLSQSSDNLKRRAN